MGQYNSRSWLDSGIVSTVGQSGLWDSGTVWTLEQWKRLDFGTVRQSRTLLLWKSPDCGTVGQYRLCNNGIILNVAQ